MLDTWPRFNYIDMKRRKNTGTGESTDNGQYEYIICEQVEFHEPHANCGIADKKMADIND